jgi:hypothetical protein
MLDPFSHLSRDASNHQRGKQFHLPCNRELHTWAIDSLRRLHSTSFKLIYTILDVTLRPKWKSRRCGSAHYELNPARMRCQQRTWGLRVTNLQDVLHKHVIYLAPQRC